jgi:sugar phosphate permease
VSSPTRRPWLIWAVAVLAYAVAVLQRTSLGVAVVPATQRFHVGTSVFSTFAVVQLLAYALMQVPVGVLVDRFGSRGMVAVGAVVMSLGQVELAFTHEALGALLARVLVGAGDAMTFVSVLRLIPAWFPARRVPLITQLTGQLGQLGQVASTIPLVAALAGPGWTPAYLGAAAIGVLAAILVATVVRNSPKIDDEAGESISWKQAGGDLRDSFLEPGTRLGLWSHFSTQFSGMTFALLWGYPFLTVGMGYSPGLAGGLLTMMVLAASVIGLVLGTLTGQFPLRRSNLVFGVLAATVVGWTVILLWPGRAPLPLVILLILILAAFGPASAIGFDFARSFNPASRLGTASGVVNMGGFTATLVTIFVVGVILDVRAPSGQFTLGDFKVAFCFQYLLWAFGLISLVHSRRLTRANLRQEGTIIDPLPSAIARHWRDRGHGDD